MYAYAIIKQNKFQIKFLDKLVLKKDADKKLMINVMTCSMLNSPSISDYYDMDNGVSNSIVLEAIIKHLLN